MNEFHPIHDSVSELRIIKAESESDLMSFSFFKPSRPKTPQEVVKAIRDSLMALDTKTVVEVKALEKALEEVEKNFSSLRGILSGDGETEPNADQAVQLALEFCKEDVVSLVIHKLHILGWEVSEIF